MPAAVGWPVGAWVVTAGGAIKLPEEPPAQPSKRTQALANSIALQKATRKWCPRKLKTKTPTSMRLVHVCNHHMGKRQAFICAESSKALSAAGT
ncbi:MAG: hypothetical protein DLM53_03310 [Candidatus Eremiobacter antarcticus]|nr:MAG: hypothetical protein DLM53_03310 [Candidatus Eremiobacter sp. RRmetagenome_bin22]